MNIQWNKVTWYSKLLALALFVALPFLGFYYGIKYGEALQTVQDVGASAASSTAVTSAGADYYHDVAAWQTDSDTQNGFSIAYPLDFDATQNYSAAPSTDWSLSANGAPGVLALTVMIPRAFEPQTNFADAKLTVGHSGNQDAVTSCLAANVTGGPAQATSTAMIDGVAFTVFHASDAGAGNYYQTTSYHALHDGQCYVLEYTIHSSQIANYPPQYQLQPFDAVTVSDVMDRMVGTFTFL